MEAKNQKVLEALQMQPLSEEEKQSRHILARLYGPIATTLEKTRNGRGYNKDLWEKALADELFHEKIANKSLFLELGHPVDREETDMTKVCACIPECPKIVDGDLFAYVDILDTDNGKLLKTLCDYGFIPGISSRGSGDIMENNDVDPETFFLETWDIVQLPAVKKARLRMCESLEGKNLQTVLQESYIKGNKAERKRIKEAVEALDLQIPLLDEEDIPWEDEEEEVILNEEADDADVEEVDEVEVEVEAEAEEEVEEPAEEEAEEADTDAMTIQDIIDQFADYDKELAVTFAPIQIDDKSYEITELVLDDESENGLIISLNYVPQEIEDDNIAEEESIEELETSEESEATEESTDDVGEDDVIEGLKEVVRQKDAAESELRELRNQKAVSDAEVERLSEQLERYKTGFARISTLASKAKKSEAKVASLSEQLAACKSELKESKANLAKHTALTEGVRSEQNQIKVLKENLKALNAEKISNENSLNEQLAASKKALTERTQLARAYKAKCDALVERYIQSKADMLGVSSQEIISRLGNDQSLDKIDAVCESMLNAGRPTFNFGAGTSKVAIRESVKPAAKATKANPDYGYEIDDDLLVLAGLKDTKF